MYGKFYLPCRYIRDDIYEIDMRPTYDSWYNTTYAQIKAALTVALENVYGPTVTVMGFSKLGGDGIAAPFLNLHPRNPDDLGELITVRFKWNNTK